MRPPSLRRRHVDALLGRWRRAGLKAAEYYGQQISLGLDGDPQAAAKARPIVRQLLGGKVELVPGEDGSLWAEYGLHMTALLQVPFLTEG